MDTIQIFERSFPDQRTRDFYTMMGFRQFVQVNHGDCLVNNHFDQGRFDEHMYTPERPAVAMENPNWGYPRLEAWAGHMDGPPPDFYGMIQVDIERPIWNLWRAKDVDFVYEHASSAACVVGLLASAIRHRWPDAFLTSYNYIHAEGDDMSQSHRFEGLISRWFDGNCPSIYLREAWSVEEVEARTRTAIIKSLNYKGHRPDFMVYVEIWKLFRDNEIGKRGVVPIDISRAQVRAALSLPIDGIVIFDTSEHQEATLPFAEMIVDELSLRDITIVE